MLTKKGSTSVIVITITVMHHVTGAFLGQDINCFVSRSRNKCDSDRLSFIAFSLIYWPQNDTNIQLTRIYVWHKCDAGKFDYCLSPKHRLQGATRKQLRTIYLWRREYLQRQKHEWEQMYETNAIQVKLIIIFHETST